MGRGVYTRFCAGVLFPLHERLKRHDTVRIRRELEVSQWWPVERLRALQLDRLRTLLRSAKQRVPYYRDMFVAQRFNPDDISKLADIAQLPLLTKALIRANTDRMKADGARNLVRSNTGGSSGEPLTFYLGLDRISHDVAAKWRATRWWGVDIGDREIVVWGSPIELGAQDRLRALRDRALRTRLLPAFEMSAARIDEFVAEIRGTRPKMLFGYPSSLSHIARHARATGQRLDDLGIEVAFVTSERLYDDQRASIGEIFNCRVANGYGGRDAGFIAHECPDGEMHVTAEDIIVEIVDTDGKPLPDGREGEIVVTHLATADFPLIRYRTGDVATLSRRTCRCGRGLPVIENIQGRSTDFVVAQDGTVMHGLALIYILRELSGIAAFKIIQESLTLTRVQIVPEKHVPAGTDARIRDGVRKRLGAGVDVVVDVVEQIPAERSGKFRYVISHVATRRDPA